MLIKKESLAKEEQILTLFSCAAVVEMELKFS